MPPVNGRAGYFRGTSRGCLALGTDGRKAVFSSRSHTARVWVRAVRVLDNMCVLGPDALTLRTFCVRLVRA